MAFNHANHFFRVLPNDKLVDREGGIEWITTKRIMDLYLDDLMAAGIDPLNQSPHSGPIVSRRAWLAAVACVRLTGQPLDAAIVPGRAKKIRAALKARRGRLEKAADAHLAAGLRDCIF